MQEWQLYNYFEYYGETTQTLHWKGHSLRILETGKLNRQQGPDYSHCTFEYNGIVYHGAVEIHVTAADWYNHRHHLNPEYSAVLLHIVAEATARDSVSHVMRTDAISTFCIPIDKTVMPVSCSETVKPVSQVNVLQNLALKRLANKEHYYRKRLQQNSAEQVFYEAIFRALGYPANKEIFYRLAMHLPFVLFRDINDRLQLLAIYFGQAGFIKQATRDAYSQMLSRIYTTVDWLPFKGLALSEWRTAAIRPWNHPQFRLAGWVALLIREKCCGVFSRLVAIIEERLPHRALLNSLLQFFLVDTDDYWKEHFALGRKSAKAVSHYFGRQRILEFISNIVIPLMIAQTNAVRNPNFIDYLQEFYLWLPGKSDYSSIYRSFPQLQTYQSVWPKFNLGQALLSLTENYCLKNNCRRCPLQRRPDKC